MSSADQNTWTQISVASSGTTRVVSVDGELDLASYEDCLHALCAGSERHVVLDLAATTFLDCAGYRAIAGFQRLRGCERTFAVLGANGEPAYALALIRKVTAEAARAVRSPGVSLLGLV